jgi:hypothetical protein
MLPLQRRVRLAMIAMLTVALAAVGQEFRVLSRQQSERQSLAARQDRLHGQVQRLQTENGVAADELAQASQELAQLQSENQTTSSDREIGIRSWLRKSQYFRDLFAHRPGQAIPELQLLTPSDWLRLSHEAKAGNESEIRQALAAIRTASTRKFIDPLATALKKYTESHDGTLPPSATELAPYLDAAIDPSVLGRYEMLASGKVSDLGASPEHNRYVITQSAPIDADYDYRDYVSVPPDGSASGPWRTDEMSTAQREAATTYTKETGVQFAKSTSDLIPYVASPAIREILLGLEEYRKEHPSKGWPQRASQLLPLLTSPEAKAKAVKFWPEELATP